MHESRSWDFTMLPRNYPFRGLTLRAYLARSLALQTPRL